MALGRINMRYHRVECKPPSDMTVIVDQNRGSGGWIRLQVKVSKHLLASLLATLVALEDCDSGSTTGQDYLSGCFLRAGSDKFHPCSQRQLL